MEGSEKQVAWAKQITATWIDGINAVVATAEARVANNTMPTEWADIVKTNANTAIAKINAMDNASGIIDHRHYNMGQQVFDFSAKKYEEIKNN